MKLFTSQQRKEIRGSRYAEHPFDYLDLSARPMAQMLRKFLQEAFDHYPDKEKINLKTRMQCSNILQSEAAMFELLLHEILLQMGCQVEIEPKVGNKKRPDFLVTTKKGNKFYLEATSAHDYDNKKDALEKTKYALIDELNDQFSKVQDAALWISIVKQDENHFRKRKLYTDIRCKLDELRKSDKSNIKWKWKDEKTGWCIELQLWKRSGTSGRFVSTIYPQLARNIDVHKIVTNAVRKKGTKYGKLDHPLILAVNVDTMYLDKIGEMEALFGKELVVFIEDEEVPIECRQKNGAWLGPKGPQNKRVCAAWLFDNLTPWRLHAGHTLYLNPFSAISCPKEFYSLLPYAKVCKKEEKMQWETGHKIFEIFNLSSYLDLGLI